VNLEEHRKKARCLNTARNLVNSVGSGDTASTPADSGTASASSVKKNSELREEDDSEMEPDTRGVTVFCDEKLDGFNRIGDENSKVAGEAHTFDKSKQTMRRTSESNLTFPMSCKVVSKSLDFLLSLNRCLHPLVFEACFFQGTSVSVLGYLEDLHEWFFPGDCLPEYTHHALWPPCSRPSGFYYGMVCEIVLQCLERRHTT